MAFGDIIQRAEGALSSGTGTSINVSLGTTPVSGNLIVAVHMTGAVASTGCSSTSGSYSSALAISNSTDSDETEIYYREAGASEATTVTATNGSDADLALVLCEIEGPWNASPLDLAEAGSRQASGTSLALSTTNASAQADEVAIAAVYTRSQSNGSSASWSNSYIGSLGNTIGSRFKSIAVGTKLLTVTGTQSTTLTLSTDTVSMGGIVSFKKASGSTNQTVIVTDIPAPVFASVLPVLNIVRPISAIAMASSEPAVSPDRAYDIPPFSSAFSAINPVLNITRPISAVSNAFSIVNPVLNITRPVTAIAVNFSLLTATPAAGIIATPAAVAMVSSIVVPVLNITILALAVSASFSIINPTIVGGEPSGGGGFVPVMRPRRR